jgi:hypothetical protein
MKTKLMVVLAACIFLLASSGSSVEQNKGAAQIVLPGGSSGNVTFPHQKHQNVLNDCKVCHDLYPAEPGSIEKLKADGKLKKKEAMNQCKDCHKQGADKGEKSGPTGCKKCHVK